MAPKRGAHEGNDTTDKVVNQMLTEMNGLQEMKDIVVIGATNRPDLLDAALLGPGRFDRVVLVSAPDAKARKDILKIHTKKMPVARGVKIDEMAQKMEGYVGADIEAVCREAAIIALRESEMKAENVSAEDFDKAIEKVRPSVTKEIKEAYEKFGESFSAAKAREMNEDKPSYMG